MRPMVLAPSPASPEQRQTSSASSSARRTSTDRRFLVRAMASWSPSARARRRLASCSRAARYVTWSWVSRSLSHPEATQSPMARFRARRSRTKRMCLVILASTSPERRVGTGRRAASPGSTGAGVGAGTVTVGAGALAAAQPAQAIARARASEERRVRIGASRSVRRAALPFTHLLTEREVLRNQARPRHERRQQRPDHGRDDRKHRRDLRP